MPAFSIGDPVSKVGGDYRFDGVVRGVISKLSGEIRYVVEDDRGVLHIYSDMLLVRRHESGPGYRAVTVNLNGRAVLLEIEAGHLVKVDGARPDYMGGYSLARLVKEFGEALAVAVGVPAKHLGSPHPPPAERDEGRR